MTPSGMPTEVAISSVNTAISTVTRNACPTIPLTGWPRTQLLPRLPDSAPEIQLRYWLHKGWSRPKKARRFLAASGSELCPSICATTSPGTARTIRNTRIDARNAVTNEAPKRRSKYLRMAPLLLHIGAHQSEVPAGWVLLVIADALAAHRDVVRTEQEERGHRLGQALLELDVVGPALGGVEFGASAIEQGTGGGIVPIAEIGAFRRFVEMAVEGQVGIRLRGIL